MFTYGTGWQGTESRESRVQVQLMTVTLQQYIDKYFGGSKARFAEAQRVKPPQVTQWLNKSIVVVDDEMYSRRRKLNRAG